MNDITTDPKENTPKDNAPEASNEITTEVKVDVATSEEATESMKTDETVAPKSKNEVETPTADEEIKSNEPDVETETPAKESLAEKTVTEESVAETPAPEEAAPEKPIADETAGEEISVEESVADVPVPEEPTPDEEETETERMISEVDSPSQHVDYSELEKEQLLAAAQEANNHAPREAIKRIQEIRSFFFELLRQNKKDQLRSFIDAGNDPNEFEYSDEEDRKTINLIYHQAQEARKEERERIESEKLQNLKLKRELLEKLKAITENDETENSLNEVKQIQQGWKKIRVIPREYNQELWDSYNFYLDKFYDDHSINIELKELDRKKNLEVKIDLCKKVDELLKEDSLKKGFILLNKYQEEFRNTGPVPREFSQEIWERFKGACDAVYSEKKELFEAVEAERKLNLEQKELLIQKASLVAADQYDRIKDWNSKSNELDKLFEEWKKVGPVPKTKNDDIWKRFRAEFNTFYKNRSAYFKQLNNERKANLILKEDLCKRAEELKDSTDFAFATKELIKLQEEWKKVGPVPDKVNNKIWKRFRGACDIFFEKKKASYEEKNKEEIDNLKGKKAVVERLNNLVENKDGIDVLKELKDLHKAWIQIGFVPRRDLKKIESAYRKATEAVYKKHNLDKTTAKQGQMEEHYKTLAELPNGKERLENESRQIKKKMSFLNGEIQTWENNIEFFGRSKSSQKLKDEIQAKIDKAKTQVDKLRKELKTLKGLASK